jgi:hypothetical protein
LLLQKRAGRQWREKGWMEFPVYLLVFLFYVCLQGLVVMAKVGWELQADEENWTLPDKYKMVVALVAAGAGFPFWYAALWSHSFLLLSLCM